eukprot:maker-scaffold129_size324999-snap-gene-2.23 protein:Tk10961 transcript:maker-scaffold129_size324999-snap-gene-2.23-mRNA-1 annotation:"unnamed protein product"
MMMKSKDGVKGEVGCEAEDVQEEDDEAPMTFCCASYLLNYGANMFVLMDMNNLSQLLSHAHSPGQGSQWSLLIGTVFHERKTATSDEAEILYEYTEFCQIQNIVRLSKTLLNGEAADNIRKVAKSGLSQKLQVLGLAKTSFQTSTSTVPMTLKDYCYLDALKDLTPKEDLIMTQVSCYIEREQWRYNITNHRPYHRIKVVPTRITNLDKPNSLTCQMKLRMEPATKNGLMKSLKILQEGVNLMAPHSQVNISLSEAIHNRIDRLQEIQAERAGLEATLCALRSLVNNRPNRSWVEALRH